MVDYEKSSFDPTACTVGLVHVGYGAFHRAHQAVFVEDYMAATGDLNWGIAAVNIRARDSVSFSKSAESNNGYLLKTTTPAGRTEFRLVRSHLEFIDWIDQPAAAEAVVARPSVKALTITVTESGYYLDGAGELNEQDPVIADELAGHSQRSIYAYFARALSVRRNTLGQPISLLCCDNIRGNGHMLSRSLTRYLECTGRGDLAAWTRDNVTFPCSMVDRITPRATTALGREVQSHWPKEDWQPIHSESFAQWVLEDNFAAPMPDLARAGVQVVDSVDPFEEAKIRILNGGHSAVCYLGVLAGYQTFDQAILDPALGAHFDGFAFAEVLPTLDPASPVDGATYAQSVKTRFSNIAIADSLRRICMNGYVKMPLFVRPTIAGCLERGIHPKHAFTAVASWYVHARRYAAGIAALPYDDDNWAALEPLLVAGAERDMASSPDLWADLPVRFDRFVPGILNAIAEVEVAWPVSG